MSMSEKTALELNQELAHELTGERGHTIKSIFLIAEIEQKQLFVELGYGSMWDFLSRMHKQSNTMIHYRLRCARAVTRFPQVIEPLRDGNLCITTLAELMKIMNESNCDELLAEALGKSKREVQRIVAREKPQHVPKDVQRSLVPARVTSECAAPLPTPRPAAEEPVQSRILTESLARVSLTVDREYEELRRDFAKSSKRTKSGRGSSTSPARTRSGRMGRSRSRSNASSKSAIRASANGAARTVESAGRPIASSSTTNRIAPKAD